MGDNAVEPVDNELPTCSIKESESTIDGEKHLPKLVIRFGKRKSQDLTSLISPKSSPSFLHNPDESKLPDEQPFVENTKSDGPESDIDQRLKCFGKVDGQMLKGTFLLLKEDLLKPSCPLWKVDNQNLLQKYCPFCDDDGSVAYRGSSTV